MGDNLEEAIFGLFLTGVSSSDKLILLFEIELAIGGREMAFGVVKRIFWEQICFVVEFLCFCVAELRAFVIWYPWLFSDGILKDFTWGVTNITLSLFFNGVSATFSFGEVGFCSIASSECCCFKDSLCFRWNTLGTPFWSTFTSCNTDFANNCWRCLCRADGFCFSAVLWIGDWNLERKSAVSFFSTGFAISFTSSSNFMPDVFLKGVSVSSTSLLGLSTKESFRMAQFKLKFWLFRIFFYIFFGFFLLVIFVAFIVTITVYYTQVCQTFRVK